MADEVAAPVAEVVPAPAPEVTATPDAAVSTEPEAKPADPPKTFTQEELDAAISKRLAREQRKWEREQAQKAATAAPAPAPAATEQPAGQEPDVMALAEQIAAQREQAKAVAQVVEAYHEREETAREKYDDFDQVAYNPTLPITDPMAATIRESEVGPEIIYYLGQNPAEAKRIAQLSPLTQAKEIGKLETKLASSPPAKRTSSAPAPITPVTGKGSTTPTFDTTDPRSIAAMDTSTWIAKERERQMKKLGMSR
jgi:hypothetical protein